MTNSPIDNLFINFYASGKLSNLSPEMTKLNHIITEAENNLTKNLDNYPDLLKLFNQFSLASDNVLCLTEKEAFKDGFSLAMLICFDAVFNINNN